MVKEENKEVKQKYNVVKVATQTALVITDTEGTEYSLEETLVKIMNELADIKKSLQ